MSKREKSTEIKKNDARKYNKRLAPKPISTKDKMIAPAKTNKAKKERIESYAVSAMKEEFGSEREFFKYLAQQSKVSFNAMKLFLEYAYGKPSDSIDKERRTSGKAAPTINFNMTHPPELEVDNTIDITEEDEG